MNAHNRRAPQAPALHPTIAIMIPPTLDSHPLEAGDPQAETLPDVQVVGEASSTPASSAQAAFADVQAPNSVPAPEMRESRRTLINALVELRTLGTPPPADLTDARSLLQGLSVGLPAPVAAPSHTGFSVNRMLADVLDDPVPTHTPPPA